MCHGVLAKPESVALRCLVNAPAVSSKPAAMSLFGMRCRVLDVVAKYAGPSQLRPIQ